ncbi:MAG: hypothetical protein JXA82_12335 [Sedimentisphaerales bacterium]|nr:hypothetical protein [Sedimentisphaerales bacterium]
MSDGLNRRSFLATSAAGAMIGLSFEEQALLARPADADKKVGPAAQKCPMGKIGDVEISRIICGGNLISGYAHSRDLIYVSPLMQHYFTDEKIMDTWQVCEENGINACIIFSGDPRAVKLFGRYRKERGGKMKWLAQTGAEVNNIPQVVDEAMENEAAAIFLVGNQGDRWTFDNRLDLIDKFVRYVKKQGVPAGVAGHSLEMLIGVETAGIENDFYMKTLHHTNYWSTRQPGQNKAVIENYGSDNYWDLTPAETVDFMKEVKKPWIAYKVLAAGAIHPNDGFDFAFKNGADFACVGMFDWQVAEDVEVVAGVVNKHKRRDRAWMG